MGQERGKDIPERLKVMQEYTCWARVSHSAGLERAGKVPGTSWGRWRGSLEVLVLEQDKATTHPLIYLKYVLIELLLFARDCARSWGYGHKKCSSVLCSHGPDLVELMVY